MVIAAVVREALLVTITAFRVWPGPGSVGLSSLAKPIAAGGGVSLAMIGMPLHHPDRSPPGRLEIVLADPAERGGDLLEIGLGANDGPGLDLRHDGFRSRAGDRGDG